MTRNVSIEDATVEITAGLYDTSEGFRAQVEGDDFPRVHISPQGGILTGDGNTAPTAYSTGSGGGGQMVSGIVQDETDLSGGDFTDLTIVDPFGGVIAGGVPRSALAGLSLFLPSGGVSGGAGIYVITESGPCTPVEVLIGQSVFVLSGDLYIGRVNGPGETPEDPAFYFSYVGPREDAANIAYDKGDSGLTAENVQAAIDELAALIAAL